MKHLTLVVFVAATLACPSSANAEMSYAGVGASPCSFLNANAAQDPTKDQPAMQIFAWVEGFISGMNGMSFMLPQGKAFSDLSAIPTQMQWNHLVAYCKSNPSAPILKAAVDLAVKRLKPTN
jgi:hypothetical protein